MGWRVAAATLLVALGAGALVGPRLAGAAAAHAQIEGDGSTWAQNAVNQWVADVSQNGLQVVFTGVGSAQGRQDFAHATTDFAVSDIGYQGSDPVTGAPDSSSRPYVYVPIVAGGTAFPYQIKVGGQLVRNLRLSGQTIAKIFTNKITNWDDPEITADNNGVSLPSLPIIPVVHSEGAGSTAQFTQYLASEFPSLWTPFLGKNTFTEYWPENKGNQVSQNGSDGVMNFLTSGAANGSIGYDEYSYALQKNFPVVKVENSAGYFTAPTQYNVAVALTQAQINYDKSSPDYLLQVLTNVYSYSDPRTYPLSSYSYGIIPTSATDPRMDTAKRQTLADFLGYATCQGQAEMGPIGYSPLPINLVQASFQQVALLKQADPNVSLSNVAVQSCHNPTFVAGNPNENYLAQIAPQPPACDKAGAGPCTPAAGIVNQNPTSNGSVPRSSGSGSSGSSGPGSSPSAGPSGTGSGGSTAGLSADGSLSSASTGGSLSGGEGLPTTNGSGTSTATSINPATGQPEMVSDGTSGSYGTGGASLQALGTPTIIGADQSGVAGGFLAALATLLLLLVVVAPPLVDRAARRRGPQ